MHIVRSIIFNIVFFVSLSFFLIFSSPLLFFDKKYSFMMWHQLSKILHLLTKYIAGIDYKIENPQNISKNPAIYAIRHESIWETLILINKFKNPVFILKQELLRIPLFGHFSKKTGAISINRNDGVTSLTKSIKAVKKSIENGHSIIIFPEGTRVESGKYVEIKRGIALFYKQSNCPVIPIIHNSGKYWPKRGFLKKPGCIKLKILNPINPGLPQEDFIKKLNETFKKEVAELTKESSEKKCP